MRKNHAGQLGTLVKQRQLQALKNFVQLHDLPLGVVINNGEQVELVADKIIQLPAGCV
jgi:hypothetical protein